MKICAFRERVALRLILMTLLLKPSATPSVSWLFTQRSARDVTLDHPGTFLTGSRRERITEKHQWVEGRCTAAP